MSTETPKEIENIMVLSDTDVAAIRATIEPWTKACLERDWDTILAMCTDDIVFLPPNEPTMEGDAVRGWLENFPTIKQMAWDIVQLDGSGDLACTRGWIKMTLEVSGEEVLFNGKYTDICRKQPDGTWRYSLVIFNSNDP